jgi:hypothetical protein
LDVFKIYNPRNKNNDINRNNKFPFRDPGAYVLELRALNAKDGRSSKKKYELVMKKVERNIQTNTAILCDALREGSYAAINNEHTGTNSVLN